ncbi:hypothetical protein [Terribacillus sp. DMT04]|uniref:hypothetical protein n=1 Tax=Terribacillus sp. DMT04 TaxID=2850441 RepID=UPI001C2C3949|nr:hypothetical protein [Terribacillus sp. DMT04]QXE03625.1 hypothetical protein KS242_17735 [Terribacillus sp. DMT04]
MEMEYQMKIKESEEQQATENYNESCSCGGIMVPMYDEYPTWLKFCSTCDTRSENTDVSPILEPV